MMPPDPAPYALQAARSPWFREAVKAIVQAGADRPDGAVTSDDLAALKAEMGHKRTCEGGRGGPCRMGCFNVVGSAFLILARLGILERVGPRVASVQEQTHGRRVGQWRLILTRVSISIANRLMDGSLCVEDALHAAGQGRPQTIPFPLQRELRAWDIQTEGG